MSYYEWKPYVPVAARRRQAEQAAARARKSGAVYAPVEPSRGAIATTFWGKAWCENLEAYSDYANRLPRGRSYVRSGAVIDLQIGEGEVQARVMGSSLYQVGVKVAQVPAGQWQAIGSACSGSIDSLVELLQGKLSNAVMERICAPRTGLFPAPKEMQFSCSCPDWASMCKHVAAVLYGVGARLDRQPELLFRLRRVDARDLVSQAGAGLPKSKTGPAAGKILDGALLADVFGIEMDEPVAPTKKAAAAQKKPAPAKAGAKKAPSTARQATGGAGKKSAAIGKAASTRRSAPAKPPAKAPAVRSKSTSGKLPAVKSRGAATATARKKPAQAAGAARRARAK